MDTSVCPTCGHQPCRCQIPDPPDTVGRVVELHEQIREAQRRFFAVCAEDLSSIPAVLEVLEKGLRQIREPLRGGKAKPGPQPGGGAYPTREAFLAHLHRAIRELRADGVPVTQRAVLHRCQRWGAMIDLRQFQRYCDYYITAETGQGWNAYVLDV